MTDNSDNKVIPLNLNKQPARSDAVRNRKNLLEAAEYLFEKDGIEAVTMSAIAKQASVGKGTLYRHFKDKADLCHALLDEDMREFQAETLTRMRNVEDPEATLRWFLQKAVRYVIAHNELLTEVANQGGIETITHPAHLWWWQTIRGLVARLQPEGDASYFADVLYVMLDVQTIRFQRRTQGYNADRIITGLHDTMSRLICTHSADEAE